MELQSVGRLALALVCIAMLILARWRHEQQMASGPPALRSSLGLDSRPGRRVPRVPVSLWLYWLGLTTSAALAAQAIAALVGGIAG